MRITRRYILKEDRKPCVYYGYDTVRTGGVQLTAEDTKTNTFTVGEVALRCAAPGVATHSGVPLDELCPAHIEPPQLLGQAPARLRLCGLHQEVPHLVQVGLAGAPLRNVF